VLTAAAGSPENPLPRRAARILLVDAKDRVLMFRGTDPGRPGSRYWFTAGGGIDPGESVEEGAVRELREETGLSVHPGTLGEPVRTEVTDFPYDGRWYRQEQQFFLVRVHSWDVTMAGFDVEERRSIDDYRWWTVDELETTAEKFYPADLAGLLREMVDR
jgi:8-oxo-dGTP pyrophosphatase MutT (NUDIX family)